MCASIEVSKSLVYERKQLKVGAIPLKSKEEDVRLYAEFQTQLYIPPPVTDGIVLKSIWKYRCLHENNVTRELYFDRV